MMNTNEVAALTGVSVRTLHYYDKIGLLCPCRNSSNDYREYSDKDLDLLQQILFFKECGFPLATIRKMFSSPFFDRDKAFELQQKYLLHEKQRIDAMLDTLEKTMKLSKGETTMTQKEKFGCFDMTDSNPYEEDARQLWGNEAVDQSKTYLTSLSSEGKAAVSKGFHNLFCELAAIREEAPNSDIAQKAMDKMYRYFNENLGYKYSLDAFAGVGQMYINDARFTENVDKYGEGLSAFLAEAMRIYSGNHAGS